MAEAAPETFVSTERRADGVALVRLDRPKANALSGAVLAQLRHTAEDLTTDPPGITPSSTSGSPKRESTAQTRKSQASASSSPPPSA